MNVKEQLLRALSDAGAAGRAEAQTALRERIAALSFGRADAAVEAFLARAGEAGSAVYRCADTGEAGALIADLCTDARSLICADDPLIAGMDLEKRLAECDCTVRGVNDDVLRASDGDARTLYADADVGLTVAHAGLADSGAILVSSSQSESRSVSLLPAWHVAVLPAGRILPSLLQAVSLLRTLTGGSSAVTLVGGPSKTADIEKVLVTGVHGPAVLRIIVIDSID